MLQRCLVVSLLFGLVACARPGPARTASVVVTATPGAAAPKADGPRSAAIALSENQSVVLTADGTMLDVTADTRVAVGPRVFTVKKESETGKYDCHLDDYFAPGDYDYEGDYQGEGISLVDGRGEATVVVEKMVKEEAENAVAIGKQGTTLLGVVGPYLFLREDILFYGCGGAHPVRGVGGIVYDTASKQKIELTPPASALESAKAQLAGRGLEEEPKVAEATPHFDAEGRLSIRWRFEKATSYAETEGDGSDYTLSVVVESSELPALFSSYREPPPAIRNYLANGGEPISGYTVIEGG